VGKRSLGSQRTRSHALERQRGRRLIRPAIQSSGMFSAPRGDFYPFEAEMRARCGIERLIRWTSVSIRETSRGRSGTPKL